MPRKRTVEVAAAQKEKGVLKAAQQGNLHGGIQCTVSQTLPGSFTAGESRAAMGRKTPIYKQQPAVGKQQAPTRGGDSALHREGDAHLDLTTPGQRSSLRGSKRADLQADRSTANKAMMTRLYKANTSQLAEAYAVQ